jgi:hypothetical protein
MLGWAELWAAAGPAAAGACRTTDVVVTPAVRVAGGMTEVRSSVTRSAVAGAAGRVVGITLKVAASPFLLILGGDTLSTPGGGMSAFSSLTRRGSVPRASPPA